MSKKPNQSNLVKISDLGIVLLLLSMIFVSSFIASFIQSSGGRVDVQTIKFPTQNGQLLVGDLFKPKTATKENPAPLVIVIPGFQRSKETLSNISIELSRIRNKSFEQNNCARHLAQMLIKTIRILVEQ